MGQKINPNIFQIEKTNDWQSKYFEKKNTEYSIYSKKDVEIRNFIDKFFKNQELVLHHCKLYYLNESLHIFISYHQNHPKNLNKNFYLNNKKTYKINQIEQTIKKAKNKSITKLFNYKKRTYITNKIKQEIKKNKKIVKRLFTPGEPYPSINQTKQNIKKSKNKDVKQLLSNKNTYLINQTIKKAKNKSIAKLFNYRKTYLINQIKQAIKKSKNKSIAKLFNYKKTYLINQTKRTIKKNKKKNIKKLFNYKKFYTIEKIKNKFKLKKNRCKYKRKKLKYTRTKLKRNSKKTDYSQKKLKSLKKQFFLQHRNIKKKLKTTFFLENFFESLTSFTNEKTKIFLVLQHANNDLKQKIFRKTSQNLKKKLTSLRKYQREDYFEEGIDLLFTCLTHAKSSKLLAKFITLQLNKLKKQQHRFLNFIKHTLTLLKKRISSKCKGIKIEIKGRITKATRAKNRLIKIAKNVPLFTIDSNVDYSEETAFATNGTIGVKVWIYEF